MNTAKIYIGLFESFINFYKEFEPFSVNENGIRNYLSRLVKDKKSNTIVLWAIHFKLA